MAELFNPLYPDPPVTLKVAPRNCKECGRPFVPVSKTGTGATHCPDCRKKITAKAREKSLEVRAANKAAAEPAQPEPVTAAEPQPVIVTTMEWWDTKEKLPDTSRDVFEISNSGVIQVVFYSTKHRAFNVRDTQEEPNTAINVAFWADIPENLQQAKRELQTAWIKAQTKKEDNN